MGNFDVDYIRRTTDFLALVEGDTQLHRVGANWYAGACPFCGGTDRFVLKQTADGWRWLCRHCTDGKYLDILDYIQRRDGVNFKEALERLGCGKPSALWASPLPASPMPPPAQKPQPEPQGQDPQRIERLTRTAYQASDALEASTALAAQVRAYLLGRGLIEPTLRWALLGAAEVFDPLAGRKRPAVSIPYFNTALDVRAIKYRFADNNPGGLRYIMEKGSRGGFYYFPEHLGHGDRLVVVEGELNLLSVAQTMPEIDLLSTGSQELTAEMMDALQKLRKRYRRVFVWLDDGERAAKLAFLLRGEAFQSPVIDGEKWDANRLLQADMLNEFVKKAFGVDCHGWTLKEWRAKQEVMHG